MTSTIKAATSGGAPRSGGAAPVPPPPPPAPPPGGDDDRILLEQEVYDLLRLEAEDRTPDAIANVPRALVAGRHVYLKAQVINWIAMGGDAPRSKRRMHR